jgi:hypothetical protein
MEESTLVSSSPQSVRWWGSTSLCCAYFKDALKSTATSAEFLELNDFKSTAAVIGNDNFWKYLFLMCHALYAPMRVLRLADQKTPAMDKLYYYVLQADRMLLQ